MWCPSCRDEFRAGYTRCPDCDTDLVATRPPAPVRVRETSHRPLPPPDDVLVEFDLADWPEEERVGLELRLRMAEIPFDWDGGLLVVNEAFRDDVAELIDFVDDVEHDPVAAADADAASRAAVDPLASPGRRFVGLLVDGLVLWLVFVPVRLAQPPRVTSIVVSAVVGCAYEVGLVARFGRTIGALLAGVRIRRTDGREPPGLRVAAIRWLVPSLGVLLWPLGAIGGVLNFAWTLAVYLPVFWPRRQGLHDRAAHTVVTRERTRA